MNKLTQRQLKALETKRKILDTALKLFMEKGFDHVTIDDIAEKTGTSKGAFYNHFKSKHEIFIEKFKEIDDFYIDFVQNIPSDLSADKKILLLIEGQMGFLSENLGGDLVRTIYISALHPNSDSFLSQEERPLYKIINSFVKEGQDSGEFRRDLSAKMITELLTRACRGTCYDWCINNFSLDIVIEGKLFITAILDGIKIEH